MESSVAEREILDDAIDVGLVNDRSFAEPAATFRVFTGEQMASSGVGAQHFAGGGDFETFGDGFLCFDAFGTTHKVNFRSKRAGNIGTGLHRRKRYFERELARKMAAPINARFLSSGTESSRAVPRPNPPCSTCLPDQPNGPRRANYGVDMR